MSCFVRLLLIVGCLWSMPAWADRLIDRHVPVISYVNFASVDPVNPRTVSGQLRVPVPITGPMPAVVVVHGSAGVDSRGQFYIEALNAAGIATLEIDMWAARGWLAGVTGRPRGVPEKCSFCYQRIDRGLMLGLKPGVDKNATPACVVACPVEARTFGDLNDPESIVSKQLASNPHTRLREDLGTGPRVYYLPAHEEVSNEQVG